MFLKVSHLGEHEFDFSLVRLLFETCDVLLEDVDFTLEFGLNALEGKEVATFPLVLLGVVVSLSLHLLGLAYSDASRVH